MARRIHCRSCGATAIDVGSEDWRRGWRRKVIPIALNVERDVFCDLCGSDLRGQIVLAVTDWDFNKEEPALWEHCFGRVLDSEEVAFIVALGSKDFYGKRKT